MKEGWWVKEVLVEEAKWALTGEEKLSRQQRGWGSSMCKGPVERALSNQHMIIGNTAGHQSLLSALYRYQLTFSS